MADDQFQATGNWWESATRNSNVRYESGASQSSSSGITNFANWQQQQQQQQPDHHVAEHMKPRTSMDSGGSSVVFHDPHKLHPPDSATSTDPNLHMMGLGLSSPSMDWDQPSLLRGEKAAENSFRSMLQESGGMGLSQVQWRDPSASANDQFKQVNKGFSLDQNQFSPQYSSGDSTVTSQGLHHQSTFHQNIDSSALYGSPSSILMQGLLGPENNQQANSMNFPYPSISYGLNTNNNELVPNAWSKAPQFLRASPPKQLPPPPNNHLHFTNNAPFWNASEASAIKDVRSSFFPSSQTPFSTTPNFDVQSKNMSEVRDSGAVVKKSGSEQTHKRPRNETTPSPLPAFKVRKEKMGDRITALQQLVSPFGKTDTASVLSEAIEYIKFLHEQVTVLSNPYMKSGAPIQIQQSSGKSKEGEGTKQDLRSRGLCLVPVSSTFPVAHETTVDFWTPTFGGGAR